MALIGMSPLLPEQGLAALDWLLRHQCTQAMVISADWSRVSKLFSSSNQPALLSRLISRRANDASASGVSTERVELGRKQISAVAPDSRQAWLESHIASLVGKVLKLDANQIDPRQPLNTLGLDSLMAIEIKNEIESSLGVSLPLVRFLEGPDVAQLAVQVLAQLAPPMDEDEDERLARLLKQVTELSDDEAREMLATEKRLATSD
jgi:acyl carrier protein